MSIMELGAIGELVGGVAVIASLVYLAVQVRKSSSAENARAVETVYSSWHQATAHLLDPANRAVFLRGLGAYESLDQEEQFHFHVLAAQFMDRFDTMLHFEGLGVTTRGLLSSTHGAVVSDFMKNAGFQHFWRREGKYLSPRLQRWIVQHCPEAGERAETGLFDPAETR